MDNSAESVASKLADMIPLLDVLRITGQISAEAAEEFVAGWLTAWPAPYTHPIPLPGGMVVPPLRLDLIALECHQRAVNRW